MKFIKNIKNLILPITILTLFGCEDYLSEVPDNRTLIDSPEKITELLVAAYPEANYMDIAETMSDNVGDKQGIPSELNRILYNWETTDINNLDFPVDYWNGCYKAIAQANQALLSIEELGGGSDLNPQKGEALLARAYSHFMLVNLWAKHYNPNTANTDLGIPYVLEPETEFLVDYSRNTVKEVYDLVEKDLLEGLKLVTNEYEEPAFHFTPAAGNAFASRFYLYKGEWDKVIEYSSKVLSSDPSTQIRQLIGSFNELEYSQRIERYGSANDPANLLIVSANSRYARSWVRNNYGLSADITASLFGRNLLFDDRNRDWAYEVFGGEGFNNVPKFDELFVIINVGAGIGNLYVSLSLFSYAEVLLARAEAYAMTDNFDSAIEDLDSFYSVRTENYDPSTDKLTKERITSFFTVEENEFTPFYNDTFTADQRSFVKGIAEARRREYYHEGLRWFDVKRLNIEVVHRFANGASITLPQGDNRRQLQIPESAIAQGLERNPR